jgi:hypothetical protein
VKLLRLLAGAALLSSLIVVAGSGRVSLVKAAPPTWTTYHLDNTRTANYTADGPFSGVAPGWTSPTLDGDVYAEPLVLGSLVYIATERNTIYALNAADGSVSWQLTLGPAAVNPGFPCGDIDPIGITSTPVIDPAINRLYAVGLVDTGSGTPRYQHHLWAVDLPSHAVLFERVVDAPGSDPRIQNQRGALALSPSGGRVYVPFGGRIGDCGGYHGFVTSVLTSDGTGLKTFQSTTAARAGGSWATAGPSLDGAGNLFISTGNGYSGATFDRAESVIKLTPLLNDPPVDIWAPTDWQSLDSSDTDIGSIGPMLLGSTGLLFQSGKNGQGYLVRQSAMGAGPAAAAFSAALGVGGCFGGAAFDGGRIFVGCSSGLRAVTLNAGVPSFANSWSRTGCFAESPILAGGAVWWIDRCGTLRAADPATGSIRYSASVGTATHFSTPSAGGGRLFMAVTDHVTALNLSQPGGPYTPITPFRLLDTRATVKLGPNATLDVPVAGQGGLPGTGVGAAAVNLTVTEPSDSSFLTLFPTGQARPLASNLNFTAGETRANFAQVMLGQGGMVSVYNAQGWVHVVLDLAGWYAATPSSTSTAGLFRPLAPQRVLDTRDGTGGYSQALGPAQSLVLDLRGRLPDPRASAVVINLTATQSSDASYLTAYPTGSGGVPLASNLNFTPGHDVPVRAVVRLGTGASAGRISIYNAVGYVHVVADLAGWFTDGTDLAASGGNYHPLAPARILDTRCCSPIGAGSSQGLAVAGQGGVASGGTATAAVINFTVTGPTSGSYLTIYPAPPRPLASDLNFDAYATVANLVVVQLGAGGVLIYNAVGSTDVVGDVAGYYS